MRITKPQLAGVDAYRYSGIDRSLLSRWVLGPFWTWLVTLFPRNVAPNTITLLGLCTVLGNVATMVALDPGYAGRDLGTWVYASWALGLFVYQSMDAIDGKQARRLGMGSALGEMFDHGCGECPGLEVILAGHALGLSRSWWTVASQIASLTNFYASTWEEYHTGTLYLSYFSGPVEGILLIVAIYALTALHPDHNALWARPVCALGGQAGCDLAASVDDALGLKNGVRLSALPVNVAFMVFGAVGTVSNILTSYYNVVAARRKAGKPLGPPLLGFLPFVLHTLILVSWLHAPAGGGVEIVHDARFLPFLGYWGMSVAYQVSQLILAHVTKSPFPYWNGMMVYSLFGAVDANAQWLFGHEPYLQSSPVAAGVFIKMSFVIALFNYIRFAREVIWQMCEHTGIACFTVRHKDKDGRWVQNDEVKKAR
ncbi:hypothetical protein Q5752_004578 [Cryptotrichosporon argae]